MITKERLQSMSDFEVNKALAKIICKNHITYTRGHGEMVCADDVKVDYCNTPNDIMPLAFEHGISLMQLDDTWSATNNAYSYMLDSSYRFNEVGGISFFHAFPLRAIACCLILVLQEIK